MSRSMSRIEQKMSDLCKKLKDCQDTKEAIDLLNIMINMIEKAWSVHSCGYDLGFKLCNTLREAGGLDILLNCIHDYGDHTLMDPDHTHWTSLLLGQSGQQQPTVDDLEQCLTSQNGVPRSGTTPTILSEEVIGEQEEDVPTNNKSRPSTGGEQRWIYLCE